MLDGFDILTEDLDHPEGVAWGSDGMVYAGGEAGQIYDVDLDGRVRQLATTGGEILGVALDGRGRIYACDPGNQAVMRIDPRSGSMEPYSVGTADDPMRLPNALAFDEAGNLYVTDSGAYLQDDGLIYRVGPDRETIVWSRDAHRYPNGCCLSKDGSALLVVESYRPGVVRIPIGAGGSAERIAVVVDLPGTVPDGIAVDAEGRVYVSCYRPDRVYVVEPGGRPEVLIDDPHGAYLNAPTNLAFVGERLDRMVIANVGEWHLLISDPRFDGHPLHRPMLP